MLKRLCFLRFYVESYLYLPFLFIIEPRYIHRCCCYPLLLFFFFFQAEDGIRDIGVTGVQTCALPILTPPDRRRPASMVAQVPIGAATAPTKAACGQASRPMPPAGSRSSASGRIIRADRKSVV